MYLMHVKTRICSTGFCMGAVDLGLWSRGGGDSSHLPSPFLGTPDVAFLFLFFLDTVSSLPIKQYSQGRL